MENEKIKKDVGFVHDLIFYLQACVSAEHHALESYCATKENIYLELSDKIRRNRSKKMYLFIKESKAQIYCLSKHLMQMAQSCKELANRYSEMGETKLAEECLNESADYEAIFIILNGEK